MLTNLPWDLGEGFNTTLSIVSLWSQCWHIIPSQGRHNVHHGLGLVGVRRDHPRKEVIPGVVTQLWGCGCIANLRYLQNKWEVISVHGVSGTLIEYHKRLNGQSCSRNIDVSTWRSKYGFRTASLIRNNSLLVHGFTSFWSTDTSTLRNNLALLQVPLCRRPKENISCFLLLLFYSAHDCSSVKMKEKWSYSTNMHQRRSPQKFSLALTHKGYVGIYREGFFFWGGRYCCTFAFVFLFMFLTLDTT